MRLFRWISDLPWTATVVALLLGANLAGYLRWEAKRDPEYALQRAEEAVQRRDPSLFDAWVDVDKLAASYYEQHLLPLRLAEKTADDERRRHDVAAVARRLRRWVVTTRIDESETPRLTLLGAVLRGALTHERGTATVEKTTRGGRTVVASVKLVDELGRAATLDLRLDRQRGGTWRISEVTNVEDLVETLRFAEIERVRRARDHIAGLVHVSDPWLVEQKQAGEAVTRLYAVRLTSTGAAAIEWSGICASGNVTTTDSGHRLSFAKRKTEEVTITCSCESEPCGPPFLRIEAASTRKGEPPIRRVEPLPLD